MQFRLVIAALMFLVIATAIVAIPAPQVSVRITPSHPQTDDGKGEPSMKLSLSDGHGAGPVEALPPVVDGTPLSEEATRTLLARLGSDEKRAETPGFALRPDSKPAPRPGETIPTPFPPPVDRQAPDPLTEGPLHILRFAPEGEVDLAGRISITFSQAMVPIGTTTALEGEPLPVRMTPTVEGSWRWVGTQTLVFESGQRLPGSTRFDLEVPADVTSYAGTPIEAAAAWSFTTPSARLVRSYPSQGRSVDRQPVIYLEFDQRIDASAVLPYLALSIRGGNQRLRLATDQEIAEDDATKRLAENRDPERSLFVIPTAPLPHGTAVEVVASAGLPSVEGPLTSRKDQRFGFSTYGAFRITDSACGWNKRCPPGTGFRIEFSNPIDTDSFTEAMITASPEIPDMQVVPGGATLNIRGLTRAETTYTITIDGTLTDRFGQKLGGNRNLRFEVDEAEPNLYTTGGPMTILDPSGPKSFPVYSIGHESFTAELYRVTPEDWYAWLQTRQTRRGQEPSFPGERVWSDRVAVTGDPNAITETRIDLSPALDGGYGQLILTVEGKPNRRNRDRFRAAHWVQVTDLRVSALVDDRNLYAWVNRLADGQPVDDATIELRDPSNRAIETMPMEPGQPLRHALSSGEGPTYLLARAEDDLAILPQNLFAGRSHWVRRDNPTRSIWHVFDDRGLYKPGETAHIRGWLRTMERGPEKGLELPREETIEAIARDARGNVIAETTLPISDAGGFNLELALPEEVNLGPARIELRAGKTRTTHMLTIGEFRRPEFEVTLQTEPGPHIVGGETTVMLEAAYYAGGALSGTPVDWQIGCSETSFTPPNRNDFSFGGQVEPPFRIPHHPEVDRSGRTDYQYEGTTGGDGRHGVRIGFDSAENPVPQSLSITGSATDINQQRQSATKRLLVHPASLYVGLRSERYFIEAGKVFPFEAIVTDLDGNAVPGHQITLTIARRVWHWKDGYRDQDRVTRTLTSASEPIAFDFTPEKGGSYALTATIRDGSGRVNQTRINRWVAGAGTGSGRRVDTAEITLIADRDSYKPGDVAEIMVAAPFTPARGHAFIQQGRILESRTLEMDGGTTTIRVPITADHVPNLDITVFLDGAEQRTDHRGAIDETLPLRPAFAEGSITLDVPPHHKSLEVEVSAEHDQLAPGESTRLALTVRDAEGGPVGGAEAVVWVVDEALLGLADYRLSDPLGVFFPKYAARVSTHRMNRFLLLSDPDDLREQAGGIVDDMSTNEGAPRGTKLMKMAAAPVPQSAAMSMADGAMAEAAGGPAIAVREDFRALAAYYPSVRTNRAGSLELEITLPDNLSRYRIMAVAVAGTDRFGTGESTLTARLPLMIRPALPRFLNFGDSFDLATVVQNQTGSDLEVAVAVAADNARLEDSGRMVAVPAHSRVRVLFPASAGVPGTARFRMAAAAGETADAAALEIPIWTPATTEAFATYGTLDEGAVARAVRVPTDVYPEVGGLTVTTSSTALHTLTDAVLYLKEYPHAFAEPLASRILSLTALADMVAAFDGALDPTEVDETIRSDLDKLAKLQNPDGGFGYWRRDNESSPYLSIHVGHALTRAELAGHAVPDQAWSRMRSYLQRIDRHISDRYGKRARHALEVYAFSVLALTGDTNDSADQLFGRFPLEETSLEALGRLLPHVSASNQSRIMRHLMNRVEETAEKASFAEPVGEDGWLLMASSRRADAIVLDGLIQADPDESLIPKLIAGLMAARVKGRWGNTQENVFVLLAMNRYFRAFEATTPDFVARVWLGEGFAGEHRFTGRDAERREIDIPMTWLMDNAIEPELLLAREGEGRLYYRMGMRYAPTDLELEPAGHGFFVERSYEPIDDPEDVQREPDGSWRIREGAEVAVVLTMVAPGTRHHVALIDPLPAGLEAETVDAPRFRFPPVKLGGFLDIWWPRPWYDHQNIRDERVEAMTTYLSPGVHTFRYTARATTRGSFVVPPTRAEELYNPETFGRAASTRVIVE